MRVLNVGGGSSRSLPPQYKDWEQVLLDIDPDVKPDLCLDARLLSTQEAGQFDAIYSSHNLEHFYQYEVPTVLAGFLHVLKPGGVAEVQVPDIEALVRAYLSNNFDINDLWYRVGKVKMPISFHDVLYGWSGKLKEGNHWYAHKCGFTPLSLSTALNDAGFKDIGVAVDGMNIFSKGYKPCQP